MPTLVVDRENSGNVEIYYEDHGAGKPVVLIHGLPLSGRSWEKQLLPLLEAGCRVVTYDRRGFGESSKPTSGYDYDTFAADLDKLLAKLDLRDVTLVGFSMGGGDVARYLGAYGSERVARAVFIGAVPPYLLKTPDNPEGVDGAVFERLKQGVVADRPAFLAQFLLDFYNADLLRGTRISDQAIQMTWNVAVEASPKGTLDCITALSTTDFRDDLRSIDVPTLVIHGDADRICPLPATGKRTAELVRDSRLVVVEGGSHGVNWTHAEVVNRELLTFIGQQVRPGRGVAEPPRR